MSEGAVKHPLAEKTLPCSDSDWLKSEAERLGCLLQVFEFALLTALIERLNRFRGEGLMSGEHVVEDARDLMGRGDDRLF